MYVAIPKELNRLEPRVAATPGSVKQIIKSGLNVYVESGAGLKSFICSNLKLLLHYRHFQSLT